MTTDVKSKGYVELGKQIGKRLAEMPGQAPGIDPKEFEELKSFDFLRIFTTEQVGGLTDGMTDVLSAIWAGFRSDSYKKLSGPKQVLFQFAADRLSTALADGVINRDEASELAQLLTGAHAQVPEDTPEYELISELLKAVERALSAFGVPEVQKAAQSWAKSANPRSKYSP